MPKSYSNRVSALSKASVSLLKDLGSFDLIQMNRYCKINQMHVSENLLSKRFSVNKCLFFS